MKQTKPNQNSTITQNSVITNLVITITSILMLLLINFVSADLYISEVLYDPLMTESGGEAVELYNSGNDVIDISGYAIKTASSEYDATLPQDTIISADGYYLIADANWDEKKDSMIYPSADHEEAITMTNTAAGVALVDAEGNILDKVGWGEVSDQTLFSITPANRTTNGQSLIRISYTGNNQIDFIASEPQLINSRGEQRDMQNNMVDINVNVRDIASYIQNITLDYDFEDKIFLRPGSERILELSFLVDDELQPDLTYVILDNSYYDIEVSSSADHFNLYELELPLQYYQSSGNYTLSIFCNRSSLSVTKNISFEILPLLAFEIDLDTINCSISYDRTCLVEGDSDISTTSNPTIQNLGNTALDFKMYAANLSSQADSVDIENIQFSFDGGAPDITLTNTPVLYQTDLVSGEGSMLPFSLLINMPLSIPAGDYSTKLTLLGVSDE